MSRSVRNLWSRIGAVLFGMGLVSLASPFSTGWGDRPILLFDQDLAYSAGMIQPGGFARHSWTLRNDGAAPLRLRTHFTGGRCGFSLWQGVDQVVPSGESYTVHLTWPLPGLAAIPYAYHAEVWTNNPDRPRIRFRVVGKTTGFP